ncbi:DUF6585 family protein [Streptomyces natalensis]|uniref:DUF6585 family protein n=1 Tax=Streptomyces natalensis TaxID=68242 RepID=UPI0004ABBF50|nr:DUF6585 family protein [Streptomyces natalensis]
MARISAAAGRERIGRRCATYAGAARTPHAPPAPVRWIRGLPAFVRCGRRSATKSADARLDLYEHGLTVAVKGRIHVVRYDTTAMFRKSSPTARTYTLTDVEGKRVVLLGRPEESGAEEWGPEIQRAITHAQLPQALAALDNGARLVFGDIWLTRERVGVGEVSVRWPQVRQIDLGEGAVRLVTDGKGRRLVSTTSPVPNLFVLRALVERLRTDGMRA